MKKKNLIIALSLMLIAVISVGATLAYFSAQTNTVTNMFTLGSISATLTEPDWDPDAEHLLMPGDSYLKDPTINIGATSQPAWVFIKVTITDAAALQAAVSAGNGILDGIAADLADGWTLMATYPTVADDVATYVYGFNTTVSANGSTNPLFTEITLPTSVTGVAPFLSLADGFTITATGYAVQAANVADLDAAYALAGSQFGI